MNYKVIFHAKAISDIETSFEWGVRNWGSKQAGRWSRRFYKTCQKRLSKFPEACPLAPECAELGITVRQLIIDRYRALFIVEGNTVEILYVRGAYVGASFDDEETKN